MVRFLGLVFIGILISSGIIGLDIAVESNYIIQFLTNDSLQIIGTIIALNVATVTFLLGNLSSIERSIKKESFKKTRSEIKQNIYFMVTTFPALLAINVPLNNQLLKVDGRLNLRAIVLSGVGLLFVFFVIYSLLEIVSAVFNINRFIANNTK